jgi:hypothetical protein
MPSSTFPTVKLRPLYFWWSSKDSCHAVIMESPVLHLKSTVPITACEMALVWICCPACCINSLQAPFCFLRYFLRTTSYERPPTNDLLRAITAMARENIAGDKLSACTKVNGSVSAPFSPGLHILSVILGFELGGMNYINQIWNLTEAHQGLKPTLGEIFAKFHDF